MGSDPETVELTADTISLFVHTSTENYPGPVARYLLCLLTQSETLMICKLEEGLESPKKKKGKNLNHSLVFSC